VKVVDITRKFKYNSVDLHDPNASLSADDVRQFYATQYPELLNAVVEGPVTKAGVATYTFMRAAGAKGAKGVSMPAKAIVERALAGPPADDPHGLLQFAMDGRYRHAAHNIANAAASAPGGTPMNVPSRAFGIFG
jgi:PRTRC genetic system protein C